MAHAHACVGALEKEKKERDRLAKQLESMQEKLLVGGENIVEKVEAQEAELQKQR